LGAGQALKYAPIFGEIIAELIIEGSLSSNSIDIKEFSIARFTNNNLSQYWQANALTKNSL
jgi:hypothetical protein